ncbi:hypothetical protein Htur_0700 [Haloterrigena turkmenica DSM 5511]|uniref:Uncharacterized protein n=1 Tax=Haloterrigena turkmenica (strain ATCC 51198 / DSM 5511 / JCM 9101 / NCIMB 13204 / VKM B-1734 / 4k) TaxID=543526 RepID=D2RWY5_HALTV|nr:hypothetical protein [Haloterrigena turkmenica]ADB59597.1 hypothetical protein Htur_0700 [Haloterrigena turkmenica DSM 5511]
MEFAVSRAGTTRITLHGGSDTTACDDATDQLAENLERLAAEGTISDWEIDDADVYEHPTAPFDPYTIALEFSVTVVVDAEDADAAAERGAGAIDDALETAEFDAVSYTSSAAASVA